MSARLAIRQFSEGADSQLWANYAEGFDSANTSLLVAIDTARMRSLELAWSRTRGAGVDEYSQGAVCGQFSLPCSTGRRKSIKSRTHNFPTQVSACLIPLGEKSDEGVNPLKAPPLLWLLLLELWSGNTNSVLVLGCHL
jgi:hypothetical protein